MTCVCKFLTSGSRESANACSTTRENPLTWRVTYIRSRRIRVFRKTRLFFLIFVCVGVCVFFSVPEQRKNRNENKSFRTCTLAEQTQTQTQKKKKMKKITKYNKNDEFVKLLAYSKCRFTFYLRV